MNHAIWLKPKFVVLYIIMTLLLIWNALLYTQPEKTSLWHYLYNAGYALNFFYGAIFAFASVKRMTLSSSMGKALAGLGIGCASYGIGLFIWTYYNIILHVEVPYPSIADAFFLFGFVPFCAYGAWLALKIVSTHITSSRFLEGLFVFLISASITFGILNRPDLSRDLPLLTLWFNFSYPLGDTILLTLAFMALRVSGGTLSRGMGVLVLGFLFQVAADVMFSYRTVNEIYWNGDVSDLLFTISAFFLSLSILYLNEIFSLPQTTETLDFAPTKTKSSA